MVLDDDRSSERDQSDWVRNEGVRGVDAHLGHEKKDADEGQPGRDAREPEPGPPGQQLDDVAVREDPPARTPAG